MLMFPSFGLTFLAGYAPLSNCVCIAVFNMIYIYIYDMSVRAVLPLSSSRLYTEAIKSKFNSRAV